MLACVSNSHYQSKENQTAEKVKYFDDIAYRQTTIVNTGIYKNADKVI